MKRVVMACFALTVAFTVVACNDEDESPQASDAGPDVVLADLPPTADVPPSEVPAPGEECEQDEDCWRAGQGIVGRCVPFPDGTRACWYSRVTEDGGVPDVPDLVDAMADLSVDAVPDRIDAGTTDIRRDSVADTATVVDVRHDAVAIDRPAEVPRDVPADRMPDMRPIDRAPEVAVDHPADLQPDTGPRVDAGPDRFDAGIPDIRRDVIADTTVVDRREAGVDARRDSVADAGPVCPPRTGSCGGAVLECPLRSLQACVWEPTGSQCRATADVDGHIRITTNVLNAWWAGAWCQLDTGLFVPPTCEIPWPQCSELLDPMPGFNCHEGSGASEAQEGACFSGRHGPACFTPRTTTSLPQRPATCPPLP